MNRSGPDGGRGSRAASPDVFPLAPPPVGPGVDARVTRLSNGLLLLTERVPTVRSVAAGVWVRQGPVHEAPAVMGVSHLLEHMVFKGTHTRSARDIALSLEALGGSLDAYTSREHTSYQARVLDRHLSEALDVLADLTRNPRLRDEDLRLEREVVLEEIATVEDMPDDLVFDRHGEAFWSGHPYGRPILGTRETVAGLTAADLAAVHARAYTAGNMVVAVAGNLDHEDVATEIDARFGTLDAGRAPTAVPPPEGTARGHRRVVRGSAQSHVVFGGRGVTHRDPLRFALTLLVQGFGGGMSSRLFQRVREELGLAYTVYAYQASYSAAGTVGVYLGTRPETEGAAVEVVLDEMDRLRESGLSAEELAVVREQAKGHLTLSMESMGARMHRLAAAALQGEPVLGLDALLERYDGVTREQVAELAAVHFRPAEQLVLTLGPDAGDAPPGFE
ncbi:MAG: pitrilysin family protein [Longimicrobiales bacterium]|nr:pitrilysin family protein [Longimicrobiales bacterium]